MRVTVSLDADVEALIRTLMTERRISFEEALNQAIRAGAGRPSEGPFRQKTFRMGSHPKFPLDKALALSGVMEDEELARKLQMRVD